jgi:hypothetical protein
MKGEGGRREGEVGRRSVPNLRSVGGYCIPWEGVSIAETLSNFGIQYACLGELVSCMHEGGRFNWAF